MIGKGWESGARNRTGIARLLWAVACTLVCDQQIWAQEAARGTLHIVWDTSDRAGRAAEYYLVETDGRSSRLDLDMSDAAADQLLELNRRAVELRGFTHIGSDARRVVRVREVRATSAKGDITAGGAATSHETLDFVTVLCRFADDPEPAFTRGDVEVAHGASYPGLRHFYAELSWNAALMGGSRVTEWYMLPHPREAYVTETDTDFGRLADDCTDAAEPDVDFPAFFGINLQFSSGLGHREESPHDTLSFGGSWALTLNGESRSWGVTWLSGSHAANYVVLAHEVGHALGWPHSSGAYGGEYDSEWDVMSRGYLRWEPPYGWLGVHTISQHKDMIGWVPAARRWTPSWGKIETGHLGRTALPPSDGYLFAQIPTGSSSYYTVESRQLAGHDRPLPAEAVVLHRVMHRRAYVVDVDNNGDPNDAGAQWRPGEEFQDSLRGFSMRVDSASAAGFQISITRGWRLDVVVEGPGQVGVSAGDLRIECDTACSTVVTERGKTVLIEPAPAAGGVFSRWEGGCDPGQPCTLEMNGNRRLRAIFETSFAVAPGTLRPAVMGAEYRDSVAALGAPGAVTWSVAEGGLPPGLMLDGDKGTIAGVPEAAGAFAFTLAARSGAAEARHATTLSVTQPILSVDGVIDQLLAGGGLNEDEIRFLDLIGNRNGRLDVGDVRRWLENADVTPAQQGRADSVLRPRARDR